MEHEPIWMDGVDVKNCKGIDLSLSPLVKCKSLKFKTSDGGIAGIWCSDHTNCYFKQLARKTQECEQKDKEINELHLIIDRLLEASGYDKNISSAEDFEDVYADIDYKLGLLDELKQECEKLNDKIIDMNSIIEDAAINLGNKDFTLYNLPFEIKKLRQECEIWKNQVLILDEEDVTVEVTQEQFEEYQKLKQELIFARNEVHSKTEYIREQRDIIDKLKQEYEQLQEKYEALKLENEEGYEIVDELKHECEELKERASIAEDNFACEVQARLYHQNEWLKFSKECEKLKKQLKTSEKWRINAESLNEKLDIKNTRYRKALEELREECEEHRNNAESYCASYQSSCVVNAKITDIAFKYKQALNEILNIIKDLENTDILTFPDFSTEENYKMIMKQWLQSESEEQ